MGSIMPASGKARCRETDGPGDTAILCRFSGWILNLPPRPLVWLVLAGMIPLAFSATPVHAHGIEINEAHTELIDDVLYLNASATIRLSEPMIDALHEGVPLDFRLRIEIIRQRDFWADDTFATLGQRYRLEYQALTQQYLIINPNSGSRHSIPTLEAALSVLGTVVRLPILDANLLDPDARYIGRILFKLDDDALPVPLRLRSYVTTDWRMKSEWFTWSIQD